jgi:DNA-binding protein YbaB
VSIPKEEWDNIFECINKAQNVVNQLREDESTCTISKQRGNYNISVNNIGPTNTIQVVINERTLDLTGDINELHTAINAMIELKVKIQQL